MINRKKSKLKFIYWSINAYNKCVFLCFAIFAIKVYFFAQINLLFYICFELLKSITETAYYWNSDNTAEVDFVIGCGAEIVPIDVKSEKNVKARSLAEYRKKYEPKCSVVTSMKSETGGEETVKIPLYLVSRMREILDV